MNQSVAADFSDLVTAVDSAGLYSKLCSVRRDTYTQNAIGERVVSGSTAVITDVACQFGVPSSTWERPAGFEYRKPELTEVRKQRQINLKGLYTTIQPQDVATVDSVDYNILSIVSDSQSTFTELLVELVTT